MYSNVDPVHLLPNPWNSNQLTTDLALKLENSICRLGMVKPIIVREVDYGLQILGGQHRVEAAIRLGMPEVPVWNLGVIPETKAKEVGLIDNSRFGSDDPNLLSAILKDLGDPAELASFLPFDLAEIDSMNAATRIDLESLELDDHDAAPVETPVRAAKTHATMKFKLPIADAPLIEAQIKATIADQGFDDSDSAVNAGDALLWLLRDYMSLR